MEDQELQLFTIYQNSNDKEEKSPLFNTVVDFYETHFRKLTESIGYGVVINGGSSLVPKIKHDNSNKRSVSIIFDKGTFIDKSGQLVVVPQESEISLNLDSSKTVYIYISVKRAEEKKIEETQQFRKKVTILSGKLETATQPYSQDSNYIELCRIDIDVTKEGISYPNNPFAPKTNELDLRYVPKVLTQDTLQIETKHKMSKYLRAYGAFFAKLSSKISSFNASLVASDAYQNAKYIELHQVSTFDIYNLLQQLIELTLLFQEEVKNKVENTHRDFDKSLSDLKNIFIDNNSTPKITSFYQISLKYESQDYNFWENIFSHIKDIADSQDTWNILKEHVQQEETKKNYLLIGRVGGDNLDIEINNDYVSSNHLKIRKNDMDYNLVDIEDVGSSNGTFINGIRLEENIKRTLQRDEELKLHDESFDLYEHNVVKKFLNS